MQDFRTVGAANFPTNNTDLMLNNTVLLPPWDRTLLNRTFRPGRRE